MTRAALPELAVTTHSSDPTGVELTLIAGGDRVAFAALYSRFEGRVFGLCLALVRDRHQAEEVAQETFLQIWQKASRFDPARGSGTGWVLQIAHGKAIDRVRHSQAHRKRDQNFFSATHVTESDTVLESVLLHEEHAAVRRELPRLSAKQLESLTLAYVDGLTTQQISDKLGVPAPTVKSRIRDGLMRLGGFLAERSPIEMPA